jgi:raffinose synthase
MTFPISSGVKSNQPDEALDTIAINGLGLVNPEKVYHF